MEEPVTIASAVVLPSQELSPHSKRRQLATSASPEISSKRPRLSSNASSHPPDSPTSLRRGSRTSVDIPAEPARAAPDEPAPRRRKVGEDEEKKRGKRLFGGILGTLGSFDRDARSQKARRSEVKRKEAEARMQEKLKAQTEELDERRRKDTNAANLRRKAEQRQTEERAMVIKHGNRRAVSNMLQTNAEPRLYYLPWKLLSADEERIRAQKEEVEVEIAREEDDFRHRQERDEEDLRAFNGTNPANQEDGDYQESSENQGRTVGQQPGYQQYVNPTEEPMPVSPPPAVDEPMAEPNRESDDRVNDDEHEDGQQQNGAEEVATEHKDDIGVEHEHQQEHGRRHSDTGDAADLQDEGEGEDTVIY